MREEEKDVDDVISLLKYTGKRFRWDVFFDELDKQLQKLATVEPMDAVRRRTMEIGWKLEIISEKYHKLVSDAVLQQMYDLYNRL